ncbi:bifunctional MaoC family dehydratase N-terminal/OB-fold nucleic acid binding domain-containing protein [Amycolatopsis sp. EV170708-02-1]|uniref:bifunctional MaoC family dehydratase N-terminal/OB-fold nucleic acid binding domain-containing protein n=1 Tax=Amycolatopsis sp. EV170708-02-1 TaxID=2919322 RepID=UPI001F0BCACC|nr:OB-fold domain-containing protein [Amycolatopsis sp. EV170708-02-1]UMP04115.1 OB-fold domain-containing protein [Amycolatopsis sp. EV170708-02-1]
MSIQEAAERIAARGESAPRAARDAVNQAMVNNWVEAIGDRNPVYVDEEFAAASVHKGLVAPPAMAQVWTMGGLHWTRASDDPLGAMMEVLDEAGFTSVVATNSEQNYFRYLRHGERVAATAKLESVVGPKRTALGEGWFVTTKTTWYVGDEAVADMVFRVLKFRPPGAGPAKTAAPVLRPVISKDTEFFWAGLREGELRIQRWGETLRHPPGPMPPDGDFDAKPDYVVACGRGTVYSYVVHHHPKVPGKDLPFVVALVELEEGVRVMGELLDADPESVHIGLPVEAAFVKIDDELTLPAWRVAR